MVSHIAPLQYIEFLPTKDFTLSELSKEAFKQIMEPLKGDNVNMIRLYGMGGWDQMADSLALKFEPRTIEGRAKQLWQRLQKEKTMLIILDDLRLMMTLHYSHILSEGLMRYAIGYGLHQHVGSNEDARKQVHAAVENLKDCYMLLDTEIKEYVKMHDLVRDVAIQIASSSKVFDFTGNRLTELHEGLVCPLLKVLLLDLDDNVDVPYFISLRELQRLKILGSRKCYSIKALPEEIEKLKSLRLLDLTSTILIRIPVDLIGRLKKLEELLIGSDSFGEWGVGGTSRGGMNANLTELNFIVSSFCIIVEDTRDQIHSQRFCFPQVA
ncbi:unnamed protein product [Dovyalis caffra]|uniref:NB-ARC domain-containing protein n=1 Tax=Dovyalis caffra TaxID=77055 RepID=A0AAV1RQ00_9ROSI|nr:unnamed protein product [Dovyalis caffra]